MRKPERLRITIDLDLTLLGTIAVHKDKSRFQSMAEQLAKHFSQDRTMVQGSAVNIELRPR